MQLVEILSYSNRIKTVDDLLNHFDLVVELARDDIYKIAKSKRLLFCDFDFAYADAIEMLKSQIQKSHLKGISRFLQCENISNAVSWLITRLLANMRNITTNQKYKLYCAPSFGQLHENIKSNDEIEAVLELMELEKFDRDTIKKGLQKIWENSMFEEDFDYFDMEYLCKKFGFEVSQIVGTQEIYLQKYKKEQTESGHSQLMMVFDDEYTS
ncbi:hypothetical protein [Aliarcobacter cibarius]|uniref:Uncharacterized protein n=1 Tax=Aliarcobacter cibarius TaxID=255507 RepID=A0ABY2V2X9_9BACT|nr:hypothetical protein [Aliarcobacter cibarius]TLS96893.1 hypothetical protein FE247_09200 [Aliarcobacter cibarius]TLS97513.1 hypothetical protein FE245_09210 [Aliarcobacter cibarius]